MMGPKIKTCMLVFILIILVAGALVFKYRYDIFRNWYCITIDEKHNYCQKDEDCAFVRSRCDGAECFGKPVNKLFKEEYEKKIELKCRNYNGAQILMNCNAAELKCINDRCTSERRR